MDDQGDNTQDQNLVGDNMDDMLAGLTSSMSGTPASGAAPVKDDLSSGMSPTPARTYLTEEPGNAPAAKPAAAAPAPSAPAPKPAAAPVPAPALTDAGDADLVEVKKQALAQLAPMVNELDLTAEEKFEILIEAIRASDDKKLVKSAFDAAQGITDEEKKARALLDVVNEVNYLTQADHPDAKA